MFRRQPRHPAAVSDWELGLAAVMLLIAVVVTTLLVPTLG
jgi:hypothetical protein